MRKRIGFACTLALAGCATTQAPPIPDTPQAIAAAAVAGLQPRFEVSSRYVPARTVQVWLPPDYAISHRRYPVIYLEDGQNVYDEPAALSHHSWQIHRTLARLIAQGKVRPAILVAIWSNDNRIGEYMPNPAVAAAPADALDGIPVKRGQVSGDAYLRFLVTELKPLIDARYRTKPDRADTMLMGSSMGGLISAYAMTAYPQVFGAAACLSTSWPIGKGDFLERWYAAHLPSPQGHRLYFDYGTGTNDGVIVPVQRRLDRAALAAGYRWGTGWVSRGFPGDAHTESAWAGRVHVPLVFLLGRGEAVTAPPPASR